MVNFNVKFTIVAALFILVAGCSAGVGQHEVTRAAAVSEQNTADETDVAAKASESEVVCFHEKTIGSNRKSLRCMNKADRDRVREISSDAWLRQQRGSETGGG